jgi:hypothetical protein
MDGFQTTFPALFDMMNYHAELTRSSRWTRVPVNSLYVAPLDEASALYGDKSRFAIQVSQHAIEDTAKNLALALKVDGAYFPLRETAWKSLLDRAKIGGTALPKLSREELSGVLNACLALFDSSALLLVREEKVAAVHSGDTRDYSVLHIEELLTQLQRGLEERFPGFEFEGGYTDHSMTSASFLLPKQRDDVPFRAKTYPARVCLCAFFVPLFPCFSLFLKPLFFSIFLLLFIVILNTIRRHLDSLVQIPRRVVLDAQLLLQLHRRTAAFVLRHQPHRVEPLQQRQVRLFHHRPHQQRNRRLASLALHRAPFHVPRFPRVPALRAYESVRVSHLVQVSPTRVLSGYFSLNSVILIAVAIPLSTVGLVALILLHSF